MPASAQDAGLKSGSTFTARDTLDREVKASADAGVCLDVLAGYSAHNGLPG